MRLFWGCISILDPLSNLPLSLFVFLFSFFFFEVKGRKEQDGFRHCWEAWGRSCTDIFTDHLPHQIQGHDRVVKQQRVRGERADGDRRLPDPTPSFKTCFRDRFSVKADFWGQCFYKQSTHFFGLWEVFCVGAFAIKQGFIEYPPCCCYNNPCWYKPCSIKCHNTHPLGNTAGQTQTEAPWAIKPRPPETRLPFISP